MYGKFSIFVLPHNLTVEIYNVKNCFMIRLYDVYGPFSFIYENKCVGALYGMIVKLI